MTPGSPVPPGPGGTAPVVAAPADAAPAKEELRRLVAALPLERKVRLLTGAGFWTLPGDDAIGLRPVVMSDGPAGVRGTARGAEEPSPVLPSGSALGATWAPEAARTYGSVLGAIARDRGVDMLLGPTVNLHRSPYGGRHFEALSEDPLLTGVLAAAYVDGVQSHGVATCVKHYVGNDYEVQRHTASSDIDDRTLREVYLVPFEKAVRDGGAWTVMAAYNRVGGTPMTEHPLLDVPLKDEWGFDGVAVSDWLAARSTVACGRASLDLVMPAVSSPWGDALVAAVRAGDVPEESVDAKLLRVLRLAGRVGALSIEEPSAPAGPPAGEATGIADTAVVADTAAATAAADAVRFAVEGTVLLHNRGLLPLAPGPGPADSGPASAAGSAAATGPASIAVIGPNAASARIQGGGSATVLPDASVSPLEGIRLRFGTARVDFRLGVEPHTGIFPYPPDAVRNPVTGDRGLRVTLTGDDGTVLADETRATAELTWLGTLPPDAATLTVRAVVTPDRTGETVVGVACAGGFRMDLDGEQVLAPDGQHAPDDAPQRRPEQDIFAPPVHTVTRALTAGLPYDLAVTCDLRTAPIPGVHTLTLGWAPYEGGAEQMLADAERAAGAAEVAVVVVGTSSQTESEGFDRTTLRLPGRQDELVRRVCAANPRTVVVVNSGGPVLMPWRDEAGALLVSWFGGGRTGEALARILAGDDEPGGRMPTTWPAEEAQLMGPDAPVDGRVAYDESIHVGHRGWLRAGLRPACWFGQGIGYTQWRIGEVEAPRIVAAGEGFAVKCAVRNVGARPGKQVVQVYASRPRSAVDRPRRWLAGFAPVRLAAGEESVVTVPIAARALAAWRGGEWWYENGDVEILLGTSAVDIIGRVMVTVRG
ncbi:glycoside hydrolase family 3 C-terminal domain-containing protein [Tomitella cavernea]|uniref:Glycoside hydrolase family 3 C-terminal domain-containing protein n=1 Tax=Tomitella cavernea TaxID=1387982 RepID=A0ABP9CN85_9ACTN|nr:glycoside hydrolase family 3 C-terminal domain-containing protein [Tomitella cavernea]